MPFQRLLFLVNNWTVWKGIAWAAQIGAVAAPGDRHVGAEFPGLRLALVPTARLTPSRCVCSLADRVLGEIRHLRTATIRSYNESHARQSKEVGRGFDHGIADLGRHPG